VAEKVRIGFVGVGYMGQVAHLRNYATLEDCEVAAIAELLPSLGKKVAARYGVPKVYGHYEEMLEMEELDALVAAQPFTRHGLVLPGLAKAKLPIFHEKPLANSVETGRRIVEAVERAETWQMVGYHKRSDPATMYAKAEVERLKETGELGAMTYVRVFIARGDWVANGATDLLKADEPAAKLEEDPPPKDMDEKTYREFSNFNVYFCHQIDLLRHMLGEPYRVKYADGPGVVLVGESESGTTGVIELAPYGMSVGWEESVLVCFERGYVKVDLPAPLAVNRAGRVEILRDLGKESRPETIVPHLPSVHAMRQQAMNFVAAVRGETKPMCDGRQALECLERVREYFKLWKGM